MVNRLVIRDVQQIDKFCTVCNEEKEAQAEDAVCCQGHYRIVENPHKKKARDPEEAELDNEEVEAVVGLLLDRSHRDVHRLVGLLAHQSPLCSK